MSRSGSPTPLALLRRELRRQRWTRADADARGCVYRGGSDFVLEHGEAFAPRPLPPGYRRGLAGHCYQNAISLAVLYGLAYVEGYALDPVFEKVHAHAWNADADGDLVDATWTGEAAAGFRRGRKTVWIGAPGAAYLGVRFLPERSDDATWNGDRSILDDRDRGYPIFRERWRGELAEPDPSWTPSPPLLALRAHVAGDAEEARRLTALGRRIAEEEDSSRASVPSAPRGYTFPRGR